MANRCVTISGVADLHVDDVVAWARNQEVILTQQTNPPGANEWEFIATGEADAEANVIEDFLHYPFLPLCNGRRLSVAPVAEVPQACRCGLPVQPGTTRRGNPYNTCCKACSEADGHPTRHDDNCGGRRAGAADFADYAGPEPKEYMEGLLRGDRQELWELADRIFDSLPKKEALHAFGHIQEYLLRLVNHTIEINDKKRDKMMTIVKQRGPGVVEKLGMTATVDRDEFQQLCEEVIRQLLANWFPPSLKVNTRYFVRRNVMPFEEVYEMGKFLGNGTFGTVHEVSHRVSKDARVCKAINDNPERCPMSYEEAVDEIRKTSLLDHPGVLKMYEYFYVPAGETFYQIIEPCRGGDLKEVVSAVFYNHKPRYPKAFVRDVMKQVLRTLAFMHGQHILHKDLKPENIMLVNQLEDNMWNNASIKVIDFGLSEVLEGRREAEDPRGTFLFQAPESFRGALGFKGDIWSAGVTLYNMITGWYPFIGQLGPAGDEYGDAWYQGTQAAILDPALPMGGHAELDRASDECREALEAMLQKDQHRRPDAGEALALPWFQGRDEHAVVLSPGLVQCLEGYARQPNLKKAFFLLMAHSSSPKQPRRNARPPLEELRAIYTHFDHENTGSLQVATLRQVLLRSRLEPTLVARILFALDRDATGMVKWTEFTAAALCILNSENRPLIEATFRTCDVDGDGLLSHEDLVQAFTGEDAHAADAWRRDIAEQCKLVFGGKTEPPYTLKQVTHALQAPMLFCDGGQLGCVQ